MWDLLVGLDQWDLGGTWWDLVVGLTWDLVGLVRKIFFQKIEFKCGQRHSRSENEEENDFKKKKKIHPNKKKVKRGNIQLKKFGWILAQRTCQVR